MTSLGASQLRRAICFLICAAPIVVFATVKSGKAAGYYDAGAAPDIPAGYRPCIDNTKQANLCRDPIYKPDLSQWLLRPDPLAQIRREIQQMPSSEDLRHRELMDKLDRIEDAIRYGR